ncbi:MAG: hypothetical protein GY768_13765 [Planctomycetaceae bacterium]|nr:hypothetical protein [Planctomycetaceae bacterium]
MALAIFLAFFAFPLATFFLPLLLFSFGERLIDFRGLLADLLCKFFNPLLWVYQPRIDSPELPRLQLDQFENTIEIVPTFSQILPRILYIGAPRFAIETPLANDINS